MDLDVLLAVAEIRRDLRVELTGVDWVIADERRLTQVLRNLIDNACKHTHDGVIELGIETIDGVEATGMPGGADEPLLRFSVRDTDVGIPANQTEAGSDDTSTGTVELLQPPPGCCDLKLAQIDEMPSLGTVIPIEQWAVEMIDA